MSPRPPGRRPDDAPRRTLRVRELLHEHPRPRADPGRPGHGPSSASRTSKRVGGLGVRQRDEAARAGSTLREGAPRRPTSRLVVLAGPTAVGKGTVSRYIREQLSRRAAQHLGDDPGAAAGRGRRRALLLRQRRRVRPHDRARRVPRVGDRAQRLPLRHARGRRSTRRSPRAAACCSRSTCRARASVRDAMPEALLVFLLPPTWEELVRRLIGRGTEDAGRAGAPARDREGRTARPRTSSMSRSSTATSAKRPQRS